MLLMHGVQYTGESVRQRRQFIVKRTESGGEKCAHFYGMHAFNTFLFNFVFVSFDRCLLIKRVYRM